MSVTRPVINKYIQVKDNGDAIKQFIYTNCTIINTGR